ncbi:MAG: hypothetical protein P8Y70_02555 [Candidatus Lokiarchaeota archaeon]
MSEEKELELTCPICQKVKKIRVPAQVFAQKKFGSIKIQVPPGAVCPDHQFIVFLDPKGLVRGYEKIDILMGKTKEVDVITGGEVSLRQIINNFGLYGAFSLLHAKLFNYPAYIMRSDGSDISDESLNTFFENLIPNVYNIPNKIQIIQETNIDSVKLKEEDALLIGPNNNILQTPWKEKLDFEEDIIRKAIEIFNQKEQIMLVKQDINNFIKEVEQTKTILSNFDEIYESDLIDQVTKDLKISKLSKNRFSIIKDFIRRNISPDLIKKIKNKVQEFLNFL